MYLERASDSDTLSTFFDLKADSIRAFQIKLRNVVKIPNGNKPGNIQIHLTEQYFKRRKIVTYKGPDVLKRY